MNKIKMDEVKCLDFGLIVFGILNAKNENVTGFLYSTAERALTEAKRLKLFGYTIQDRDTRPTLQWVCDKISEAEGDIWEDYISCSCLSGKLKPADKWPEYYSWVPVYVVHGSSEGMYLHVDFIIENKRIHFITAKTLDEKHSDKLWQSAGRIAKMLGA